MIKKIGILTFALLIVAMSLYSFSSTLDDLKTSIGKDAKIGKKGKDLIEFKSVFRRSIPTSGKGSLAGNAIHFPFAGQ